MSIVFQSQVDFERAVMQIMKERITVHVTVSKISDGNYYNPGQNTKVKVVLSGEYVGEIDSDEDDA